jgi:Methyltransferase FkbM domain
MDPVHNSRHNARANPLTAIFVGCNKGDDAVSMLRKLSSDIRVNPDEYTKQLNQVAANSFNTTGARLIRRACKGSDTSRHPILLSSDNPAEAQVYCIEAMPNTAALVLETTRRFPQWKSQLHVSHAAIGATNEIVQFPVHAIARTKKGKKYLAVGSETYSVSYCLQQQNQKTKGTPHSKCTNVTMYTLDEYVRREVLKSVDTKNPAEKGSDIQGTQKIGDFIVDVLSVDVEGFDWDVLGLGGADYTLPRTRYLEFEYHGVGPWVHYNLTDVVKQLKDRFGFVCYYAGKRELWRITDCEQPYFNHHWWSNVACVNYHLQPRLATVMETMFQKQLVS